MSVVSVGNSGSFINDSITVYDISAYTVCTILKWIK